ncbi:MAG: sec-independent translocase [Streptosporangiaceae bacterium]
MFDLSITKILVLAVIALVVFGPNELPKVAAKAGQALRDLRRIADGAKADLKEGLGPEFAEFDLDDLNPKRFVQKHLLEGFEEPATAAAAATTVANGSAVNGSAVNGSAANGSATGSTGLAVGERPPYDSEAT